jgi:hypothetical protein
MTATHPFTELRRKIRQTGKQFRQNNDNSQSIFHPRGGFIYAYELAEVEAALDEFEKTLPTDYRPETYNPFMSIR